MWERIAEGLVLTVIGMGVVFFVLSIDAMATYPLKWLGGESKRAKEQISEPASERVEVAGPEEVDPEIVAAITAAIHYHLARLSKSRYGMIHRADVRRGL
ncbi:OadG family protein [Coprothermobacteraceae bacterium]|nr:OadG family protein [Coprothermobacteraceae bacterium]